MTRNDALHLRQVWLPMWTGNQPERLAEVYSEDVFYRDPVKPEGIHGNAGLLSCFTKLLPPFPDWVWEVDDVFPIDGGSPCGGRRPFPWATPSSAKRGCCLLYTSPSPRD